MLDSNPKSKNSSPSGERVIEPPLVFKTVAHLNLAAVAQAGAESSGGDSGGATAPNPQTGGEN